MKQLLTTLSIIFLTAAVAFGQAKQTNNYGVNIAGDPAAVTSFRNALTLGTGDSPTFTGVTLSGQTASSIVGFDGSKNIISLSTATYPSLTELAYVKGLTSNLQTQLNGKLSLSGGTMSGDIDMGVNDIATTGLIGRSGDASFDFTLAGEISLFNGDLNLTGYDVLNAGSVDSSGYTTSAGSAYFPAGITSDYHIDAGIWDVRASSGLLDSITNYASDGAPAFPLGLEAYLSDGNAVTASSDGANYSGVYGTHSGSPVDGYGIRGVGYNTSTGVAGESQSGVGIRAQSDSGNALEAYALGGATAVYGVSSTGIGVNGESGGPSPGILGASSTGYGVEAGNGGFNDTDGDGYTSSSAASRHPFGIFSIGNIDANGYAVIAGSGNFNNITNEAGGGPPDFPYGLVCQSNLLLQGNIVGDSYNFDIDGANNITFIGILANTKIDITLGALDTTFAVTNNVIKLTGDAGANTIATITAGVSGQTLTILFVDALVTITDTDAATANTVDLSAAFTSTARDTLTLIHDGNKWIETSRSLN
jgi:hypothetical protein